MFNLIINLFEEINELLFRNMNKSIVNPLTPSFYVLGNYKKELLC